MSSSSLSDVTITLNHKWLSKISSNRDAVCLIMQSVIERESQEQKRPESMHQISFFSSFKIPGTNFLERFRRLPSSAKIVSDIDRSSLNEIQAPSPGKDFVPTLLELGFNRTAEKLTENKGYPWDSIRTIPDPILIDQLVEIYLLSLEKKYPDEVITMTKIMDFALNIAQVATDNGSPEFLSNGKELLGQFIYLLDKKPNFASYRIVHGNHSQTIKNVKFEFSESMREICEELQSHMNAHRNAQLQSPLIALHTMIPNKLASALLTERGTINDGIIDSLIRIFASNDKNVNHDIPLAYALKLLRDSKKFRQEIEGIQEPQLPNAPINDVIRACLDLDINMDISPVHAKKVALIAVMSGLWQDGEASCFASSLVREILSSHLIFALKDLKQLIRESKLTRKNNGVRKEIPFIKRIYDENLNNAMILDKKGCFLTTDEKLIELCQAPGIQFACRAIGLTDCKSAVHQVMAELPFESIGVVKVTVKEIIKKLCAYAIKTNAVNRPLPQVIEQAYFAFSAQTAHPMLKVWTNVIANMAETEESGVMKRAIIKSVDQTLENKLKNLELKPTPFLARFFLALRKSLHECIELQYDPAIERKEGDSHLKGGGFVLNTEKGPIENQQSFRAFVLEIIDELCRKFLTKNLTDSEIEELKGLMQILLPFSNTTEFLNEVLLRYYPGNYRQYSLHPISTPLPYDQMNFTPWMSLLGNDSKAVLKNYFQTEQSIATEELVSRNGVDYLTFIIDKCKNMSEQENACLQKNPNRLTPMCIPGKHRLSFIPGNPTLAVAWKDSESTVAWIAKHVVEPGTKISHEMIDARTKKHLITALTKDILPQFFNDETKAVIFRTIYKNSDQMSVRGYRQYMLDVCERTATERKIAFNKQMLARLVDTAIYESLKPANKRKLELSAVHVADTNWVNGLENIYFCFVVNPGTGELELWEVSSDGTHLTALDQEYWLINQKWEFLIIPDGLLPEDT